MNLNTKTKEPPLIKHKTKLKKLKGTRAATKSLSWRAIRACDLSWIRGGGVQSKLTRSSGHLIEDVEVVGSFDLELFSGGLPQRTRDTRER